MSRYSRASYIQMFDALLSEELYFSSTAASQANIKAAIKRVLGRSIKMDGIISYSDLVISEDLSVHFTIKDPDGDLIPITLVYGT